MGKSNPVEQAYLKVGSLQTLEAHCLLQHKCTVIMYTNFAPKLDTSSKKCGLLSSTASLTRRIGRKRCLHTGCVPMLDSSPLLVFTLQAYCIALLAAVQRSKTRANSETSHGQAHPGETSRELTELQAKYLGMHFVNASRCFRNLICRYTYFCILTVIAFSRY